MPIKIKEKATSYGTFTGVPKPDKTEADGKVKPTLEEALKHPLSIRTHRPVDSIFRQPAGLHQCLFAGA